MDTFQSVRGHSVYIISALDGEKHLVFHLISIFVRIILHARRRNNIIYNQRRTYKEINISFRFVKLSLQKYEIRRGKYSEQSNN